MDEGEVPSPTTQVARPIRSPLHLSLRLLMAAVVIAGVGLAGLLAASPLCASLFLTFTLFLLGYALLAIVYRRGRQRAAWLGFAVFGWGYFAIAFGPWSDEMFAPRLVTTRLMNALYNRLSVAPPATPPTAPAPVDPSAYLSAVERLRYVGDMTMAAKYCHAAFEYRYFLTPSDREKLLTFGNLLDTTDKAILEDEARSPTPRLIAGTWDNFRDVGQCQVALLAACLGAALGRYLFSTRDVSKSA